MREKNKITDFESGKYFIINMKTIFNTTINLHSIELGIVETAHGGAEAERRWEWEELIVKL